MAKRTLAVKSTASKTEKINTLYSISGEMLRAIRNYQSADSQEEVQAAALELDKLEIARDEKLAGCCAYLQNLRAEVDMLDSELARLTARKNTITKRADSFKEYIGVCLSPGEKWSNALHQISWRNSEALEIEPNARIPEAYIRVKEVREPDKRQIIQDLKCGASIPGCRVILRQHLVIK